MIAFMRDLLVLSQDPENWPEDWPEWEMRDVEHVLCEVEKYEKTRSGEGTPKQLFDGGGTRTIAYGQGRAAPTLTPRRHATPPGGRGDAESPGTPGGSRGSRGPVRG